MDTNEPNAARTIRLSETPAVACIRDSEPIKVWLVDDDDGYRQLLAETLAEEAGIECPRDFRSPDEVLSTLASKNGPDVLLLDIHMRHQNGLDAVGPIKALSRNTRVLMLTTLYDRQSHSRALEAGASGFLLKSGKLETILAEIRKPTTADQAKPRRRKSPRPTTAATLSTKPATAAQRSNWWRRFSSAIGFPA